MTTTDEAGDLTVDGVNVTERVAEIEEQGYTVIPDFISIDEVARIRQGWP